MFSVDRWVQFTKNPLQIPLGVHYDCESIMHYRYSIKDLCKHVKVVLEVVKY